MLTNRRADEHAGHRPVPTRRLAIGIAAALSCAIGLAACDGPSSSQSASEALSAGIAAQKAHDYSMATADYQKVLKSEPRNTYALYDLGDVEQFQYRYASAATEYLKVLAIDPNFELALFNLGILSQGTHPGYARMLFQQAIRINPRDSYAHLHLGKVLLALHLTKAGNQQIQRAVQLNPSLAS